MKKEVSDFSANIPPVVTQKHTVLHAETRRGEQLSEPDAGLSDVVMDKRKGRRAIPLTRNTHSEDPCEPLCYLPISQSTGLHTEAENNQSAKLRPMAMSPFLSLSGLPQRRGCFLN